MIEQVKTRKRNWHTIYRLVLRKDETLEEVGSYRLTLFNIYILLSSLILVAMGLMAVVIFFTPLKRLVPGYAEPSQHPEYIKLSKKMATLESELTSYKLYYERFNQLVRQPDSISAPRKTYTSKVVTSQPEKAATGTVVSNGVSKSIDNTIVNNSPQGAILNEADYRYLMPPISGVISSAFDAKTDHLGVDILAPHDTPVKAIWDGHVITADWTLETGYTIGIQHSNDMVSFYKHNATLLKKTGAFVRAGEAVAIIGNTGKLSSGPHLHFELWLHGKPVDPTNYIDF
ncbi:MAG: M23 family metallopeptidase [Saprospiraceae bacterium]|nr:M23 family metallopeptidase [Candidatus Opimibacter iunctus]